MTKAIGSVASVRRILPILAFFALVRATPAAAHPLIQVQEMPVGRPVTVTLTILSETATPMLGADIDLPEPLALERVAPGSGWSADIDGSMVRLSGPAIPVGAAVFVSLTGTFRARGAFAFPVTTHAEDGTTVRWDGTQPGLPAPIVYAGVDPPAPPGSGDDGGRPWLTAVGVSVVLLGVGLFVLDRRRRRSGLAVDGGEHRGSELGAADQQVG
jgi:LPXTG-motif cell wall-anchored protein